MWYTLFFMVQTVITHSLEETKKLGKEFAARLHKPTVIALHGDLGAGKTTFAQGFAEALGIKHRIISPTFIIVRKYQISNFKFQISNFYHIDLYRIESERDIQNLGILELLKNPCNIVFIEWAEKMGDLLPKKRWDVSFDYLNEQSRKIQIDSFSVV